MTVTVTKKFFSVTVTVRRKFFSVRVTVDSTRDTPSCLKNFEKQGGNLDHLCRILFSEICWKKGGGKMPKHFEKKF